VAQKFDPAHWDRLENPQRLVELPPAVLVELLDLRGSETVVDFGAGTGLYDLPLAAALPGGTLLAVEELPELLDRLRAKLAAADPAVAARVQPILTAGGRVPLPDAAADRLVTINTVHHVHDDPIALNEMVRLLRPGGTALIVEFGHMDRPVGPPKDHVLPHDELRALIAGLSLTELAVHEPGTLLQYHIVVVARKPAAADAGG
jgi:ubiquinone/menaquinone biosynthesis C-methylase UbiE